MREQILVVEDDAGVAEGLAELLEENGYGVRTAGGSGAAEEIMGRENIDLILLDVRLGADNGFAFCQKLRENTDVPVLFLTACDSETELLRGFAAGGDDYVTKPFRARELIARIGALLRRGAARGENGDGTKNGAIRTGEYVCFLRECRIQKKDAEISLTAVEWKLLKTLLSRAPDILTREELLYEVWDKDAVFVDENTLNVNISRLREKLGEFDGKRYIETVWGMGYRWAIPVRK